MEVRSQRDYRFEQPREAVWEAIGRVDEYRGWWPWLRHLDAAALSAGERWECTIQPPLPYALRLAITICEVDEPSRISATVTGDIAGDATVSLTAVPDGGCSVRLTSALSPSGQPLRAVASLAPWIARFGHDWVLDSGVRQFRRRAL